MRVVDVQEHLGEQAMARRLEFPFEHDIENVRRAVRQMGISNPLRSTTRPAPTESRGRICRRHRLGGLLNYEGGPA